MHLRKVEEKLTIEKIKMIEGYENITDEEAQNIIDTIKRFARLTYKAYRFYQEQQQEDQEQKLAA